MSAKPKQKLRISLSPSEMDLLGRAARLTGTEDLPTWAKELLLAAAQNRLEEGREPITPGGGEAETSRPKCTCGATGSPSGLCDGSCIMRF